MLSRQQMSGTSVQGLAPERMGHGVAKELPGFSFRLGCSTDPLFIFLSIQREPRLRNERFPACGANRRHVSSRIARADTRDGRRCAQSSVPTPRRTRTRTVPVSRTKEETECRSAIPLLSTEEGCS